MIKKEIYKLTPQQRDIILCRRFLEVSHSLTSERLHELLNYPEDLIIETLNIYNHNPRLKLELREAERKLKKSVDICILLSLAVFLCFGKGVL